MDDHVKVNYRHMYIAIFLVAIIPCAFTQKVIWQCGFETGKKMCDMRIDPDAPGFEWIDKATPTADTGPTGGAQEGQAYVYFETSSPTPIRAKARINTPRVDITDAPEDTCIEFYYHMYGTDIKDATLELFAQRGIDFSTKVKIMKRGPQGDLGADKWIFAKIDFTFEHHNQRIGWEAQAGNGYASDIAIDNIRILQGTCDAEFIPDSPEDSSFEASLPYYCPFDENSVCGLSQPDKNSNGYGWETNKGKTPTDGTGPDSAKKGDYYIYANAAGHNPGDITYLEIPNMQYTGTVCLCFYYYLFGEGMGQLYVYTQRQGKNRVHQFAVEGNRGERWFNKCITLNIRRTEVIGFDANRGATDQSDFGLDEITLEKDECDTPDITTTVQTTILYNIPYECDFEDGGDRLCGMVQWDDRDQLDFEIHSGPTDTAGTGPDQAYSGQNYLLLEADNSAKQYQKAYIETPPFDYEGVVCISLAYHLLGDGQVFAYIKHEDENKMEQFFAKGGDLGSEWLTFYREKTLSRNDKVVIRGRRGKSEVSDIGIDFLQIRAGSCIEYFTVTSTTEEPKSTTAAAAAATTTTTTMTTTTTTQQAVPTPAATTKSFHIPSTQAWPEFTPTTMRWVSPDWPDTTTESIPTPSAPYTQGIYLPWGCSYERDLCDMKEPKKSEFHPERIYGSTPSDNTGPEAAYHGNWFLYMESSPPQMKGQRSYIGTPPINYAGDICVSFHYHMYGDDTRGGVGWLVVYQASTGERYPIFVKNGNLGREWHAALIDTRIVYRDKIVFFVQRGTSHFGDIAIDDLQLTRGMCPLYAPVDSQNKDYPTLTPQPTPSPWPPSPIPPTPNPWPPNQNPPPQNQGTPPWPSPWPSPSPPGPNPWPSPSPPGPNPWPAPWPSPSPNVYPPPGPNPWPAPWPAPSPNVNPPPVPVPNPPPVQNQMPPFNQGPPPFAGSGNSGSGRFSENELPCNERDDSNVCKLVQDVSGDDLDFTWWNGKTPSGRIQDQEVNGMKVPVTGPEGAKEGNYYIYVEATHAPKGKVARLMLHSGAVRKKRQASTRACLHFAFNMNGFHIGTLRVFTRRNGGPKEFPWSISGDQGLQWETAAVKLNTVGLSEVGFEAEVSGVFSSDISIDDVWLSSGDCQAHTNGYIWQCDFETSDGSATLCETDQNPSNNFDWKLIEGATPSKDTGPDQAYSGRYYVFAEASKPLHRGDSSSIRTPPIGQAGDVCVRFGFHMWGFHMGTLDVSMMRGSQSIGVWSVSGDYGREWHEAAVTLENIEPGDQLVFRAMVGDEFSSDIAIDHIRIHYGRCRD